MTVEQYEQMVIDQDGRCAICVRTIEETQRGQFYVDHDHETGFVRGLLCGGCNSAIGLMQESIETFERAIQYLKTRRNRDQTSSTT